MSCHILFYLFARQKGNLAEMVKGVKRLKNLKANDKVLIVEGCTHHRQDDDIGTVKILIGYGKLQGVIFNLIGHRG